MTVTTYFDPKGEGLLARIRHGFAAAFERIVAAREAEAEAYFNGYLATLDDETLKRMGKTRDEVTRGAKLPFYV